MHPEGIASARRGNLRISFWLFHDYDGIPAQMVVKTLNQFSLVTYLGSIGSFIALGAAILRPVSGIILERQFWSDFKATLV